MATFTPRSLDTRAYEACPLFAKINLKYPGLRLIHERPYIFLVDDFLSAAECEALIAKHAAGRAAGDGAARVGQGLARTSTCVVCDDAEVPALRERLADLAAAPLERLQGTKLSRYAPGQRFDLHTDAWSGDEPSDGDYFDDAGVALEGSWPACYNPNHNVSCTVFAYLNDVAEGGRTIFPTIGIHRGPGGASFYDAPGPFDATAYPDGSPVDDATTPFYEDAKWDAFCGAVAVAPKRGTAVLHFPSLVPEAGGRADGNAMHRAEPPVGGDKYVLQQFVSSHGKWRVDATSTCQGRLSETTL